MGHSSSGNMAMPPVPVNSMIISPTMILAYNGQGYASGHTLPQGMFATGLFDCCQPGCGTCCWAMCCTSCAFGDLNALWLPGDEPCCAGSCGGGCFLHFMLGGFMSIGVAVMTQGLVAFSPFFQWVATCPMRGHVRDKWGIQGNACEDCCIHYWCDGCAIMQETKEMSFRMLAQQPQPGQQVMHPQIAINVQHAMPVQAATPYNPQGQHQNHPPQTGYPQQQQPVAYAGQQQQPVYSQQPQQQQPVYTQQQQQPVYTQQQQPVQQAMPISKN